MNSKNLPPVPHLTTAMTGPLRELEKQLLDNQIKIETWLREQWQQFSPIVTCSVDIRNAGFKLSPVDTNCFPAGFNNLNREFLSLCIQAAQTVVNELMPGCKKLLLVPESHTRNPFYLHSLAMLQEILIKAGYEVRVGSLLADLRAPYEVSLDAHRSITLEPAIRQGDRLCLADFDPCAIILNNDLSSGVPDSLQGLSQAIHPEPQLGWQTRLKSAHFKEYQQVSEDFAELLDLDPWLFAPLFRTCEPVDFINRVGEDALIETVEQLLDAIQEKYDHYQIKEKPFVVVKADAGTYGMGVMMVQDANELKTLNRKQRTKMAATKGSQKLSRVIVQEGVHTFETWGADEAVAEPVVYLLGQYVIGGFYRVHKGRSATENLNAPGMHFEPLAFDEACNMPDTELGLEESPNRFYAYGVIARLAALAAAREKHALNAES